MHTLHDFMMLTKGHEYLIAVGAMLLFTMFWLLLDREHKSDK